MTRPITTAEPSAQPAGAEPDVRQALAEQLHRIADAISAGLPLGRLPGATLTIGVLDSWADLNPWAAHLGSPVRVDSNAIPHVEHRIRIAPYSHLLVQAQARKEHQSEVEALRARVAELEAQQTGGAR